MKNFFSIATIIVLGFAATLAILTALLAGLAPVLHLMRANLDPVLRGAGSRGATSGRVAGNMSPHLGHLMRLPSHSSLTFNRFPQGHET